MSYEYTAKVYCHCVQSRFNNQQFFTYKGANDCVNGNYANLAAAQSAASNYDANFLHVLPKTDDTIIFTFKDYDNQNIDITNYQGIVSQTNKTAVPYKNDLSDTASESPAEAIYSIYQKAYEVTLTKPGSYTVSEFGLLLTNVNKVFNIKLPKEAGTYKYNKVAGQWEKQQST